LLPIVYFRRIKIIINEPGVPVYVLLREPCVLNAELQATRVLRQRRAHRLQPIKDGRCAVCPERRFLLIIFGGRLTSVVGRLQTAYTPSIQSAP